MNPNGMKNYVRFTMHRYLLKYYCDYSECYKDYALHTDKCNYLKIEQFLGNLGLW